MVACVFSRTRKNSSWERLGGIARWVATGATCWALLVNSAANAFAAPGAGDGSGVHAYLFRGFINVFSLGLDGLAPKLEQRGIRADVYNHLMWSPLVSEIIDEYRSGRTKSFILIGHSAGADAVIDLVKALARENVPISLAATLDEAAMTLSSGKVKTFVNLYIKNGIIGGVVHGGPNFQGRVVNIDLSSHPEITHLTITTEPIVQDLLIKYVMQSLGRGVPRTPTASQSGRHASAQQR